MAAEPTEDAISSFISFTSSTRDQAVGLLKVNELNSNKAINAYFEGQRAGPPAEASNPPGDQNVPSFNIEQSDPVPGASLAAPPSRPPSRISSKESTRPTEQKALEAPAQASTDNDQKLSLAEREEHELQQAVAMSLNQNLGHQETGVTTNTSQQNFGPATGDYYDEGNWSMTLFNSTSREIVVSPDPVDRKRADDEPAFLRPSPDNQYLGGLITILHSIPLAREAFLLKNQVLSDYGHDPQWWNGQPIKLPKIVTIHDEAQGASDWDDILHEVQRLVAFLDSTTRAFGSSDALAGLRSLVSYDSDGNIGKFLEKWQEAAVRADTGNQLANIFSSRASKRPLPESDETIDRDFTALEPSVESIHGQTLYDVLDQLMWADKLGEELDDVWLEDVADILTIKLEALESSKSVDVKIPSVFYPDRYLAGQRELARDFRSRKLQFYEEISRIEMLISRFTAPKTHSNTGLTSRDILEKAANAVPVLLRNAHFTPEATNLDAERLEKQLRTMSNKIEDKLKELEARRSSIMETIRNHSKLFTEPSSLPSETPCHKYTLRGVCTEPHVTYVLRSAASEESKAGDGWQWWRISFSTDDAKTRQAEKSAQQSNEHMAAPKNADVIGYTARKVREIEVLRAAREESKGALLVYASDNAVNFEPGPIPPQLQAFVNMDNKSFEDECQEATNPAPGAENQRTGWEDNQGANWIEQADNALPGSSAPPKLASGEPVIEGVNVFDYEVSSFEEDKPAQEMKERGGKSLLSQSTAPPSSAMDTGWDNVDDGSGGDQFK